MIIEIALVVSFIINIAFSILCLIINKNWHDFADKINAEWYNRNKNLIDIIKSLQEKLDEYERKDRE